MRQFNAYTVVYYAANCLVGLAGLGLLGSAYLVARGKVNWIGHWRQAGVPITTRAYVLLVGAAAVITIVASTLILLTTSASRWQPLVVAGAVLPLAVVLVLLLRIFR